MCALPCLQVHQQTPQELSAALEGVAAGCSSINTAVGPAVGCLMATFGTSLITDCIFDFDDPEQLQGVGMKQRLELWGLQVNQHLCDQHLTRARKQCMQRAGV